MYENLTVESIKTDILSRIDAGIDIREGSYTNDMISAAAYEIWKLYQSLDAVVPIAYVDETSGEYIDKRCAEFGITRKAGTAATATLHFTGTDGTVIPAGKVFLTSDGLEFETVTAATIASGAATATATAAEIGEAYNVAAGTIVRQLSSLSGLNAVTNDAATGGTDAETDAALVARLYAFLQRPATSGNAYHYEQWALAVSGVGAVKVTPTWDGAGTVKVLIADEDKQPVDAAVVTACADYIEDNRPIGATVTVASVAALEINVAAAITIDGTTTKAAVRTALMAALSAYFESIAMAQYTVAYHRVAYILLDIAGVTDYTALTVNSGAVNVTVGADQVPVVGTVEVT